MKTKFLINCTLALALLLFAWPAFGQTGLSIQPVKINHTLNAGESVSGAIQLTNASEEQVLVEVKVEDWIPVSGGEGISFVKRAEGVTTVRDWFVVEGESPFLFEQGETRSIPYQITAPPEAEPGGHFGVIFFKASLPDNNSQLKISSQVGVLAYVTVPGNRLEKGRLLGFAGPEFIQRGPVNFDLKFENTGTVHFIPQGEVTITDLFKRKVGKIEVGGVSILPTGVKEWSVSWPHQGLLIGRYTARVEIVGGEGEVLDSAELVFYALPIWYLLAFLLTIIIIFFLIRFIKRRVRVSLVTPSKPMEPVEPSESVPSAGPTELPPKEKEPPKKKIQG